MFAFTISLGLITRFVSVFHTRSKTKVVTALNLKRFIGESRKIELLLQLKLCITRFDWLRFFSSTATIRWIDKNKKRDFSRLSN